HIISISSGAGLVGFEFCSAYAASKFGLEGWMESLRPEVEPFGIHTTIVNPGFFRTKLLTKESMTFANRSIEDYADRREEQLKWWKAQNGRQPGDPAKLARALVRVAGEQSPPRRFIAGADAIALAEQKVADLKAQIDAYHQLSTSLSLDYPARRKPGVVRDARERPVRRQVRSPLEPVQRPPDPADRCTPFLEFRKKIFPATQNWAKPKVLSGSNFSCLII